MPDEPVEPRRKFVLKPKEFERVNHADAAVPVEVTEILRGNLAKAPPEKPIVLVRKKSQRARDYWKALIAGNALLLGSLLVIPGNVATWVFIGTGVVIFSVGLTWVMWFIFDDY